MSPLLVGQWGRPPHCSVAEAMHCGKQCTAGSKALQACKRVGLLTNQLHSPSCCEGAFRWWQIISRGSLAQSAGWLAGAMVKATACWGTAMHGICLLCLQLQEPPPTIALNEIGPLFDGFQVAGLCVLWVLATGSSVRCRGRGSNRVPGSPCCQCNASDRRGLRAE